MKTQYIRGILPLHIAQIAAAATLVFAGIFILCAFINVHTAVAEVVNTAPVAVESSFTVAEGNMYSGVVTGTDIDIDGDPLIFQLTIGPSYGTLTLNADGSFNYTANQQPNVGFVDTDSFTFVAYDGELVSEPASVSITITPVNDAPEAYNDSFTVDAGDTYDGVVSGSDADGDSLSFEALTAPMHGTRLFYADGNFSYTADSDYAGSDSFTFIAQDGLEDSAPATISITVVGAPEPVELIDEVPVGSLSEWTVNYPFGNPVFTYEEITSPYDSSTALRASVVGSSYSPCNQPSISRAYPIKGNTDSTKLHAYLAFNSTMENYTFPYVLVYIYDEFDEQVGFQIYYGKDVVGSWYKTYHIEANPDTYTELPSAEGDMTLDLSVLGADIDFSSLTLYLANYACVGETSVTFDHLRVTGGGTGSVSENTPPVANADSFSVSQGDSYNGVVTGTDANGDSLTFALVSDPAHGSLPLINPDGSFTYTADDDYEGTDSFTFKANDGLADSPPATVSITVNAKEPEKEIHFLIYNPNVLSPDNQECKGNYGAIPYDYLEENGVVVTYWCNDTIVDASVLADYDVLYVGRARASYDGATYIDSADLKNWVSSGGAAILESTGDSFEPGTSDIIWPGIYDLFGYNNCPSIGDSDNGGGGPLTKLIDHPIWEEVEGVVGDSDGLYDSELEDSCIGTGLKIGTSGADAQNPMVNEFGLGRTYSGVLVDYTINEDSERYFLNVIEWVAQGGRERDTTAPVITLIGDSVVEIQVGDTYVDPGATAIDDVDGDVPVLTTGTVDTNTSDTYLITYTATDVAGNVAEETREVIVSERRQSRSTGTRVGQRQGNAEGQVLGIQTSNQYTERMRYIQLQFIKILTLYVQMLSGVDR